MMMFYDVLFHLQSITGAMNTINPPVSVADPANQPKVDYIQEVASKPDFEYPPVRELNLTYDRYYEAIKQLTWGLSPQLTMKLTSG